MPCYKRTYANELDPRAAMCATLIQVGRPMVSTSIAISAGFSILMLSRFTPTAIFGLLMMLTMASALASGLLILPALLAHVSPMTLEDLFRIRTGGHRLQHTVPLLEGMTRFQVHRIMKAGKIQRIEAGHCLFSQGDVADRLYVVISGVIDAIMVQQPDDSDSGRQSTPTRVNRLSVGDVIGEMGLLGSGTRCVSAVAQASGDLLMLSQAHLSRIRRLYPRTANRLLANLTKVLTEKLIHADRCLSRNCSLDPDTGLLNRDAFLDSMEQAIQRARRYDEPMAICLLTIDDGKPNACSDRLETERIVCQTARVISSCFRKIDTLGRFDSATVAILMSRSTAANATVICNRLKFQFNRRKLQLGLTTATISCRFMDLDGCWAGGRSDEQLGLTAAIRAVLRHANGHLLVGPSSAPTNC
jgi:diguanylate cyclase (GGDEF)-like protein